MHFQIAKKSLSFSVPEYESMLPKYFKVYKLRLCCPAYWALE